jgi:hypothetical protein
MYWHLNCAVFKRLPPTLLTLRLHSRGKITHTREPFPSGAALAKLQTDNLQAHILPKNSTSETKAIQWYRDLSLNNNDGLYDMIGFDNGILVAHGMCPPCEILVPRHEFYLILSSSEAPTYLMRCPSTDIWELADA